MPIERLLCRLLCRVTCDVQRGAQWQMQLETAFIVACFAVCRRLPPLSVRRPSVRRLTAMKIMPRLLLGSFFPFLTSETIVIAHPLEVSS